MTKLSKLLDNGLVLYRHVTNCSNPPRFESVPVGQEPVRAQLSWAPRAPCSREAAVKLGSWPHLTAALVVALGVAQPHGH